MKLNEFIKKIKINAKKNTPLNFLRKGFSYTTNIVRYHLMYLNVSNLNFANVLNIKVIPMKKNDTDKLSTDYFGNHESLKHAIESGKNDFRAYMFYNKNDEFIGHCWFILKGSEDSTFVIKKVDAYLHEFYTNKEFRSKGYGTEMLKAVCNKLKEENINEIELAVRNYNIAAIKCYEKVGFNCKRKVWVQLKKNKNSFPRYEI